MSDTLRIVFTKGPSDLPSDPELLRLRAAFGAIRAAYVAIRTFDRMARKMEPGSATAVRSGMTRVKDILDPVLPLIRTLPESVKAMAPFERALAKMENPDFWTDDRLVNFIDGGPLKRGDENNDHGIAMAVMIMAKPIVHGYGRALGLPLDRIEQAFKRNSYMGDLMTAKHVPDFEGRDVDTLAWMDRQAAMIRRRREIDDFGTLPDEIRLAQVMAFHRKHAHDGHRQDAFSRSMVDLGHSEADQYKRLRALYDSLPYAAGRGARFLTYVNAGEHAILHAPHFETYGYAGPEQQDGEMACDWVKRHAEGGFKGSSVSVMLDIVSLDTDRLREMVGDKMYDYIGSTEDSRVEGAHSITLMHVNEVVETIERVIRIHGAGGALPEPGMADPDWPMERKRIAYDAVPEAFVSSGEVVVPRFTSGTFTGEPYDRLMRAIDLVERCVLDGFPRDQADIFLRTIFKPDEIEERLAARNSPKP